MHVHVGSGDKTPLHQAASLGCKADVKELIFYGAMVDSQTRRGRTALHYAAENGHNDIVGILLWSGAQVDLTNKWGRTGLHYAASKYRVDCVQTLIYSGADLNKQDVDCQTPLYHAVSASTRRTHGEMVGRDTTAHDNEMHDTVICDTTVHGTHTRDTVGCDPTVRDIETRDEIEVSQTKMCDTTVRDTVFLLISHGADVNIPDKSGITPLHVAAELGNSEICIHLLKEGNAQVNAQDQHGATPLHYASYQGHRHVSELLLCQGACSTVQDNAGLLAESYAAKRNKVMHVKQAIPSNIKELQHLRSGEIPITPSSEGMFNSFDVRKENVECNVNKKTTKEVHAETSLNEKIKLSSLTKEGDLSYWLLQLNETEGVGRVRRTVEVEKIEADISGYIEATLQGMVQVDPRLRYVLLKAGSTAENTKVGEPDEIDYMCCLTDLSKDCYPYTSPNDPPGYLRIKIHNKGLETWRDFADSDGFLVAERLHRQFHSIFDRHSEHSDLTAMSRCLHKMRDYSGGSEGGVTVDMSQTKPGSRLYFLWRGCQFKRMVITVDLIPTIEIFGWPDNAIVPPQRGSYRYHVIPKISPVIQNNPSAGLFWRISTSMAEKRLFSAMDAPVRACYTICKSLLHCPDPQRLFPPTVHSVDKDLLQLSFLLHSLEFYDELINSYLLKMIFFRERRKRRKKSDWAWSAMEDRVTEILTRLREELRNGYVPSFFLRDYNVLPLPIPTLSFVDTFSN